MRMIRNCICVILGLGNSLLLKIFHWSHYKSGLITYFSPWAEMSLHHKGLLLIGNFCQFRNGTKVSVRKNAVLDIGDHFYCGNNSKIVCHHKINIGDNVQFGPDVLIYDHDHDFAHPDGLKADKYKYSPVKIGNSVWIGARTIILRGTEIGDNSIIGAGCILKGKYPSDSIIYQRKELEIKSYTKRNHNDTNSN